MAELHSSKIKYPMDDSMIRWFVYICEVFFNRISVSDVYIWNADGPETNCWIARNLGIQLMNSNCFAIYFQLHSSYVYSDIYLIQIQVHFGGLSTRGGIWALPLAYSLILYCVTQDKHLKNYFESLVWKYEWLKRNWKPVLLSFTFAVKGNFPKCWSIQLWNEQTDGMPNGNMLSENRQLREIIKTEVLFVFITA